MIDKPSILTLEISKYELTEGTPKDLVSCPISLAASKQFGEICTTQYFGSNGDVRLRVGSILYISNGPEAYKFVRRFDSWGNLRKKLFLRPIKLTFLKAAWGKLDGQM